MAAVGNITGDQLSFTAKQKEGVTLHNFPEVSIAHLSSVLQNINDASISGKRLGAQVMGVTRNSSGVATAAVLYVAAGSAATDKWIPVKDIIGTGGAVITPA